MFYLQSNPCLLSYLQSNPCLFMQLRDSRWLRPPTRLFCVPITNILVFKKPGGPNTKPGRPNTSQWNIGCVWSEMQNFRVGLHVHFIFVAVNFICVGFNFSVEYGLKCYLLQGGLMKPEQRTFLYLHWLGLQIPFVPSMINLQSLLNVRNVCILLNKQN